MKSLRLILSAAIFLSIHTYINAQVSLQLTTEQEFNSNPFRSKTPEKNFISSYDFTLQQEIGSFGYMYNGTIYNFSNTPDRNFYWHMGGFWKSFENSAISVSAEQRINDPIYTYFDYFEAALNYEHQFSFWDMTLDLYPSLVYTSYKNISILNNVKTSLTLSINKPFETGTTIITGGAINHKIYTSPDKQDWVSIVNDSGAVENVLIKSQNATSISQLTGFLRIAQSITPTTGIAAQYTNKSIISGVASSVKLLNLTYGDESEMFDDPVNYGANSLLVELTQIFFEDLQIKLGYYYNSKNYPSQGIYLNESDYITDITRKDTQNIFQFSASKKFSLGENIDLNIGLKFYTISNNSNSYLFKYDSRAFNINAGISF